ncbi:MiaB/RimO family radical SAM methylthiotransferase [Candidatus Endomicrobiellum devescovinae]|jgi:threonylcarbamoyladenosine tRNA methylthiotransferase MtaB|uniref:MiaB/RimO family radical SAM methylthiotransferase n=1 Tax=Candidatus Endomicrobiellum devescovinae TaxID=3242322 RepID=UPI002822CB78|nr:MiaB/RimO family radical SAM methylthiotransferase [Endomicrobium sp.]
MKKYFIHTFGCKVNQYESQLISENFKKNNFERSLKPEDADVIILNSCTVTSEADKECQYLIRKLSKLSNNPKLILTGCLVKNKNVDLNKMFPDIEVITDKTILFNEPQKQTVSGHDKHSRAFLKIQDGCNSFCSYCIVPYVRNVLWSKPENEVISEITNLIKNGYSEIVLTGIHLGKYEEGLSTLVEKIIHIDLDFRTRISSIDINEIDGKLIELMKANPNKICRHLHIPLQSGSEEILKQMNRKYSKNYFEEKTAEIIKKLPDLALTTDIITGFPGETEEHHKETCEFVKKLPFSDFHIFRYSDREGTKAFQFKNKVPSDEIKKRSKDLFEIDLIKRKVFLTKNLGTKRKAVKIGTNKLLTDNYIVVETNTSKISDIFEIKITENSKI